MKNFFKTSLYLLVFAIGGVLFQVACSNDNQTTSQSASGKLIYTRRSSGNQPQIWIADYDGSNQTPVPLTLPANVILSNTNSNPSSLKISPDGQKIFFVALNISNSLSSIYSCNVDGSNPQEIIAPQSLELIELGGLN